MTRDLTQPYARAELIAAGWELFSAILFISAVAPQAFRTPLPATLFLASMAVSAAVARPLVARGSRGFAVAGAIRILAWPLSISPLVAMMDAKILVAAAAFGFMAGGIRRAIYRRLLDPLDPRASTEQQRQNLRPRLAEHAMTAGIVGGHLLLLFSVAFLRTQSSVMFRAWWEIVPALAILGTVAFSVAVYVITGPILRALEEGPDGPRPLLERGLSRARALPDLLAWINFAFWVSCTAYGVFYFRTGPTSWEVGDAIMQVAFGSLFAWGVSFYQRAWHRDTVTPVAHRLAGWLGTAVTDEPITLRRRMLRDFGLPLLFMAAITLLSSIGMYRTLVGDAPLDEDLNAVGALFAAFSMLVMAVGGVVLRAAAELSRPLAAVADAAEEVAGGQLDVAMPRVGGPTEVVGLSESVEHMRKTLRNTIAELERERAGLEENVEARTAELRKALSELKEAQAALVQGERMASIGELVAGVAHEIYNPLNAIAGAATPLDELLGDVRQMLDAYRHAERDLPAEAKRDIEALREKLDLEPTLDDLVGISTVIRRATDRSVRIVQTLKNFSRVSAEAEPADVHAGLDETLALLGPRLRQACIQVHKQYGELPRVVCRAGEMNQVFMNLLVNAIQSLEAEDQRPRHDEGAPRPELIKEIWVETWLEEDVAVVAITDNGPGIPAKHRKKVFDPFFTTKPRGQGTGLGLSISTDITRRHGGTLTMAPVQTDGSGKPGEPGSPGDRRGARLVCRIPVHGAAPPSS